MAKFLTIVILVLTIAKGNMYDDIHAYDYAIKHSERLCERRALRKEQKELIKGYLDQAEFDLDEVNYYLSQDSDNVDLQITKEDIMFNIEFLNSLLK